MSINLKTVSINNEKIAIITLYGPNRNLEVMAWHQRVMVDHFQLPVNYIECPFPNASHGFFMNAVIRDTIDSSDAPDYYYWIDNDCIQLRKEALQMAYLKASDKMTIFGHAWQSNHKIGPNGQIAHPYAAPACLFYSTKMYNDLGRPDMDHWIARSDTSEEFTYIAKQKGYNISLIYPSFSFTYEHNLDNGLVYGMGNIYGPLNRPLWHHTSSSGHPRHPEIFIKTCQKVIENSFEDISI